MRYGKLFLVIAVSVLFICTISANGLAQVPAGPLKDLQDQIDDHESRIDALEQQAPAGGIKVYDANGQCFGIVSQYRPGSVLNVFVQNIEAFIEFSDIDKPESDLQNIQTHLVYEDYDCAGQVYGFRNYRSLQRTGQGVDALYSVAGALSEYPIDYRSCRPQDTGQCMSPCTPDPIDIYRLHKAIMIDKADLPFDPDLIEGPLQFKMN